jgi:parallel beta-helix repeat protein
MLNPHAQDHLSVASPAAIVHPLAASLTALLLVSGNTLGIIPTVNAAPVAETHIAQTPTTAQVLYVNPSAGSDAPTAGRAPGSAFRTITFALKQSQAGTEIRLAPGNYTQEGGEAFPLILPRGVKLIGDSQSRGQGIVIKGGGQFISPSFARQMVAVLAENGSQINGVTISNPYVRGTAVWVETSNPEIINSTFTGSHRDGVFVSGTSNPKILNNVFTQNGGNGLSIARASQGEVRGNLFKETGFGIAIGGSSSTLVVNNKFMQNRGGLVITDVARPTVQNNQIDQNTQSGIVITGNGNPKIINNKLTQNKGNGISIARNAQSEIRGNQIQQNKDGIIVTDRARPLIRDNLIENNAQNGIAVMTNAQPDLGTPSNPGKNTIRANKRYDVLSANSSNPVLAIGNNLDPKRVAGKVEFKIAEVQVKPTPSTKPTTAPKPATSVKPTAPKTKLKLAQ